MHRSLLSQLLYVSNAFRIIVLVFTYIYARQVSADCVYSSNAYILNALCIFGNLENSPIWCSFCDMETLHHLVYAASSLSMHNGKHSTRRIKKDQTKT